MPHEYPMMLDVRDRLVVIIGGGAVAARKARGLIECGATRVRCVSPRFHETLPQSVERVQAKYEPSHLDGAGLVFAATNDPAVNRAVVEDAHARGLLVNRADDGDEGDFSTPARFRESAATVTVSAGSPALAAMIRDEIARRWDPRWSRMAEAMQELRPTIVAREDVEQRRSIFRALASDAALDVASTGGAAALKTWIAEKFPETKHA